ncbi:MAG: hypothetical protein H6739_26745 [Alphaproteobacteria bacterium]|nr:hypothetical protein [Alphaproteobacteria bacterium]
MHERPPTLPERAARRAARLALKAVGGAVYYAIHRRLPDPDDPDPYWREMHPDSDKGTGPRGGDADVPPSI